MLRFLALVVILSLTIGLVSSRPAYGSCGDWLAHPNGLAAAERSADGTAEQLPSIPNTPCNGPLCRRAPANPLPGPSAPTTQQYHHEAVCPPEGALFGFILETELAGEDFLGSARRYVGRIDRPPRAW